jgi:hypothetical protein
MTRKGSNKKTNVLTIEVVMLHGLKKKDGTADDVYTQLRVLSEHTLQKVHDMLISVFIDIIDGDSEVENDDEQVDYAKLFYFTTSATGAKVILEMDKTLSQLNIRDGDRIFADASNRKKRSRKTITLEEDEEVDESFSLQFTCTTRIFDTTGNDTKKIRVLVQRDQRCGDLMNDINTLWGRTGLKFRYGRIVLNANKTFEELGLIENGEIVVTGGRGL